MTLRKIDWGGDNSKFATRVDTDDNGRAILLEDEDGETILLEWDDNAGEWIPGGPVNMNGEDVTDVGAFDAETVRTGELFTADVGELQSTLSNASPGDYVRMRPGGVYDPGSETTIPGGVTLDFNGAKIEPSGDYDVFFVDAEFLGGPTRVLRGWVDTYENTDFSSSIITLDTNRAGIHYRNTSRTYVEIDLYATGERGPGSGTVMDLTADGDNIGLGNKFNITTNGFETAIKQTVNNGTHANGQQWQISLNNYVNALVLDNTAGDTGPWRSTMYGEIQPDNDDSERAWWQQAQEFGPIFKGRIWDAAFHNTSTFDGGGVNVFDMRGLDNYQGTSPNGGGATVSGWDSRRFQVLNVSDDDLYEIEYGNGSNINYSLNETQYARLEGDTGDFYITGSVTEDHSF